MNSIFIHIHLMLLIIQLTNQTDRHGSQQNESFQIKYINIQFLIDSIFVRNKCKFLRAAGYVCVCVCGLGSYIAAIHNMYIFPVFRSSIRQPNQYAERRFVFLISCARLHRAHTYTHTHKSATFHKEI